MKSYDETVNRVFERIDQYKIKQKRKKKIVMRAVVPIGSLCIAAIIGIAFWQSDIFGTTPQTELKDSTVIGEKDYIEPDEPDETDSNSQAVSQGTTSNNGDNNTLNAGDTNDNQSESVQISNGMVGNGVIDIVGTVVVDKIQYVQFSVDETLFTPDKYLGDARDFIGTYQSHINETPVDLYTVKESDNVLMAKLSNGGTVIMGRCGDIFVNGKLYGVVTHIDPTEHIVGEFLGTADEFEIIDVPYRQKNINAQDEIWSMKDYNDGLFVKTTDGNWIVFYYYPTP